MAEAKATKKTAPARDAEVKTVEQLNEELTAKRTDYIAAKRSHAAGELVNPRVLTITRKEIARISTAIRAAELAEQKESN